MPIPYFDAHSDTPTPIHYVPGGLLRNSFHLDLERLSAYSPCAQVFAVCVRRGERMAEETEAVIRTFHRELEQNRDRVRLCLDAKELAQTAAESRIAALLSVEGADRLGGSMEGLKRFYALGVRIVHLTWNDDTALCGAALGSGKGLTPAGRGFVRAAQELGVALDMSHISEQGFWDVMEIAEKPVLAGHSNAMALCPAKRNLSDAQFLALVKQGGAAGLNLYPEFLGLSGDIDAIVAHAEHWLGLGGEKTVCLGSDFDGIERMPSGIRGVESMCAVYEAMLQENWSEVLVRDIFYNNLFEYFGRAFGR